MAIRGVKHPVDDYLPIQHVLLSVFDKRGLDVIVPALLEMNPKCMFYSTTGTLETLQGVPKRLATLGLEQHFLTDQQVEENVVPVEDYTEFPEMAGGLVKTLHPKIHAGLLGERHNPKHQEYLKALAKTLRFPSNAKVTRVFDAQVGEKYDGVEVIEGIPAVYFDMFIGNLYPFGDVVKDPEVTFEKARGNIDIGGPTMIRSGAKNCLSCAVVTDPRDYDAILTEMRGNDSRLSFESRRQLMNRAFKHTAGYDTTIADWMGQVSPEDARACYEFADAPAGGNE